MLKDVWELYWFVVEMDLGNLRNFLASLVAHLQNVHEILQVWPEAVWTSERAASRSGQNRLNCSGPIESGSKFKPNESQC